MMTDVTTAAAATIDPKTYDAAKELSRNLGKISAERIREEFLKILLSAHPDYTSKLQEIGAMPFIYPSYREIQNEAERALLLAPADKVLRLTAFLYQGGAEDAEAAPDVAKVVADAHGELDK